MRILAETFETCLLDPSFLLYLANVGIPMYKQLQVVVVPPQLHHRGLAVALGLALVIVVTSVT